MRHYDAISRNRMGLQRSHELGPNTRPSSHSTEHRPTVCGKVRGIEATGLLLANRWRCWPAPPSDQSQDDAEADDDPGDNGRPWHTDRDAGDGGAADHDDRREQRGSSRRHLDAPRQCFGDLGRGRGDRETTIGPRHLTRLARERKHQAPVARFLVHLHECDKPVVVHL